MPFSFGRDVFNEGEYAQIACVVSTGDLPLSITWSQQGAAVVSGEPGIDTSPMGRRVSYLSIESVGHRHSGIYTCTARNVAGNATYSTRLHVNGSLSSVGGTKGAEIVSQGKALVVIMMLLFCRGAYLGSLDLWPRYSR